MLLMNGLESWLDVKDYEGLYQVSDLGRVRSVDRSVLVNQSRYKSPRIIRRKGKVLKPGVDGKGYSVVGLSKSGKPKTLTVHRLVCIAFLPNPKLKPAVNHIDGNPSNNTLRNLEWCTVKENNDHSYALNGRTGSSHISADTAKNVKRLLEDGLNNHRIASMVGASLTVVKNIKSGRTWVNL